MIPTLFRAASVGALVLLAIDGSAGAGARQLEALDRGVVAVRTGEGNRTLVGWRSLATDPDGTAFNVYRSASGGEPERVNDRPLDGATCLDVRDRDSAPTGDETYSVRPVNDGREGDASPPVETWPADGFTIPIQPIEGYRPGDASAADLDGDGQYEIVLHQASRGRDNSHAGVTGTPVLDAYRLDGTHLWRIDLGVNIREGQHYTQFIAFDFDGDGRAEVACKTADGTRDGTGNVIGDPDADYRIMKPGDRLDGRILEGPEFLTVFDGLTGAALATTGFIPGRDPIDGWGGIGGNGGNDRYGNRCDRFLACAAYLDGNLPSLVMCRGVYGRTVLAAWDWRQGKLTNRWTFDSGTSYPPYDDASPYSGMGGHSIAAADVDADGRDEIVYQSMVIDDNGEGLYSTGLRHGDTMHVTDIDPAHPGLEVFTVHENEEDTVRFMTPGAVMRDAATGAILWSHSPGIDVPGGLAADIDPRHPGAEAWGGPGGLRTAAGEQIGPAPRTWGFAIWWDGDLLRELASARRITKWDWEQGREETVFEPFPTSGDRRRRGGSRYPCLVADLVGDWREEILLAAPDGRSLVLFTTPEPTGHRLTTLMHDPQYRLAVASQNVAYNPPPHPGFFLGYGMEVGR